MSLLTAYNKFIQVALKYGFSLWGTAKTGQLTSYRTGDDGYFKKGYPVGGVRFVDNGDGTITDNASGLMWIKDPSQLGGAWGTPGNPSAMTWDAAIDNCLALNYAGHGDWRLPNAKEASSLADHESTNPSIDTNFFPSVYAGHYWTSTTTSGTSVAGWYVDFYYSKMDFALKSTEKRARPVRLGVPKD